MMQNSGRLKMSLKKLYALRRDKPFLYENFQINTNQLKPFLEDERNLSSLIIEYDTNDNQLLVHSVIKEIYKYYNRKLPNNLENLLKKIDSSVKLILSLASIFTGPSTALLNAAYTMPTLFVKKKKDVDFVDRLIEIESSKELYESEGSMFLTCINTIIQLSIEKRLIIVVKEPEKLKLVDIEFIRRYMNLYKDYLKTNIHKYSEVLNLNDVENSSMVLFIFNWSSTKKEVIDFKTKDEGTELYELNKLRWFLQRYYLINDENNDFYPSLISEETFVGRISSLNRLKADFEDVLLNGLGKVTRIKAPTGFGKTSLVNKFLKESIQNYSHLDITYIKTGFSGEYSSFTSSFTEVQYSLNSLENVMSLKKNRFLMELIKSSQYEKIDSFLSEVYQINTITYPILEVIAPITQLQSLVGNISTIKDVKGYFNYLQKKRKSSCIKDELELNYRNKEINSQKDILERYTTKFYTLMNRAQEGKKNIVWMIDDIQWMDPYSAVFFKRIMNKQVLNKYPIHIIFMDREDNLSAIRNDENLLSFRSYFNNENTIELDGFTSTDVANVLKVNIVFSNLEAINKISKLIYKWLAKFNDVQKIEPFFVVELINLIGLKMKSSFSKSFSNNRREINLDEKDLIKRIQEILEKLTSNFEFTSATEALVEEKLNHIVELKGEQISKVLESAAFVGEPIFYSLIEEYVKEIYKDELSYTIKDLTDIERAYNVLQKYNNYDDELYIYSHAVYKSYFKERHLKRNSESKYLSTCAFKVLEKNIDTYKNKNELFELLLREQSAYHGSMAEDERIELMAAKKYLEIGHYYFKQSKTYDAYINYYNSVRIYEKHEQFNNTNYLECIHNYTLTISTLYKEGVKLNKEYHDIDVLDNVIKKVDGSTLVDFAEFINLKLLLVEKLLRKEEQKGTTLNIKPEIENILNEIESYTVLIGDKAVRNYIVAKTNSKYSLLYSGLKQNLESFNYEVKAAKIYNKMIDNKFIVTGYLPFASNFNLLNLSINLYGELLKKGESNQKYKLEAEKSYKRSEKLYNLMRKNGENLREIEVMHYYMVVANFFYIIRRDLKQSKKSINKALEISKKYPQRTGDRKKINEFRIFLNDLTV